MIGSFDDISHRLSELFHIRSMKSYLLARPGTGQTIEDTGGLISPEVGDLDANSVYGNPNISLAGSPPSLKLLAASGAAYNAGTGVTLASQLDTSVVDTPGSGTWSYALFIEYADGTTNYSTSVVQEGVVVA